jgi:PPM family protein phosphatase
MTLILRAVAVSDPGLVRPNNEDSALAGRRVIAIADGVGGSPAGEVASEIVIRVLSALDGQGPPGGDAADRLRAAVEAANREIGDEAAANPGNRGMGTTVTALLLDGDRFAVQHIGDSRGYLLREGALRQFTRDDTYVQALVDQGVLTAEEARRHPQRSLVTRAVHGQQLPPAGTHLPTVPGDRVLLCSDGLSDFVTDHAIGEALQAYPEPRHCAERLVKLALQVGAPDNVTVVVADVTAG